MRPVEMHLSLVCKAGGCRSGSDRGGSVWHLTRGKAIDGRPALCGAAPAIQWSEPWKVTQMVSCKRCQKIEREMVAQLREADRLGAIGLVDRADDIRLAIRNSYYR